MKAIVHSKFGPPDLFELNEVAKPVPKADEVLIRVHAASLNAFDWHIMRAKPFLVRLAGFGFLRPKHRTLGVDMAGRVEAVRIDVTQFRPNDEVFGDLSGCGMGAFAEYVCAPEDVLALKPVNTSFEEVAAVPMAAVTALQGLRDKGKIQQGQKVLIHGASGALAASRCRLPSRSGLN